MNIVTDYIIQMNISMGTKKEPVPTEIQKLPSFDVVQALIWNFNVKNKHFKEGTWYMAEGNPRYKTNSTYEINDYDAGVIVKIPAP